MAAFFSKYRVWLAICGLLLILSLFWLFNRKSEIPIRAEKAVRETIVNTISTNGKIEPVVNLEAHSSTPAAVRRVLVRQGDNVKAGELLVQLDDSDARAQEAKALAQMRGAEADLAAIQKGGTQEEVLTNRASLEKAKAEATAAQQNFAAVQKLRAVDAASTGEVEEAANRLARAKADLQLSQQKENRRYSAPEVSRVQAENSEAKAAYAAAQAQLRNSDIRATFDGTVYSLPVREGQYVAAGDLVVQVAKLEKMQVRAFVDEPEIGKLSIGQAAKVTWDATPGRFWAARVTSVPTTVVPRGTRNVGEVICSIDNSDKKLLPNINVNVTVVTKLEPNAVTISREAVFQDGDKKYVYPIKNGHLTRVAVETGIANLTRVQIVSGLEEGAEVAMGAVNGQPLSAGAPVKIVEERK